MNIQSLKINLFLLFAMFFSFLHLGYGQHDEENCSEHDHIHQHDPHPHDNSLKLEFIQNNNQFHENIKYELPLGGINKLYLEETIFTYLFYDEEATHAIHDLKLKGTEEEVNNFKLPGHAYRVKFKNANPKSIKGLDKKKHYHNYYLGKDSSKWATNVPLFSQVKYDDLYPNIDLLAYSEEEHFKYDIIIKKGGNPNDILLEYEGMDKLSLKGGHLLIHTSVGTTREAKPYTYQVINGKKIKIPCQYRLNDNQLSFHFPKGYNEKYELIIDPVVVAATLSGTNLSENFGHTACFDNAGNIYAGGISFGIGYPTTNGAFQQNFGGGTISFPTDIAVSKYNPDGSNLLYATYIGGSENDEPHSMIVDFNNQLCILGTTNSANFPVLNNAFQNTKSGDIDIVVTKINANGTALAGSTFIGGSDSDGVNLSSLDVSYGEDNRGEIMLDGQGNIYVASTSSSTNFPTTQNALQENAGAAQDGVVFKFNSDLSTLFWSTYLGGNDNDTAAGLKIDDDGNVIVVGTAGASNFPMVGGGIQSNWMGGEEDAYVVVISPNGQSMLRGTFLGTTNGNDHGYFVDIDENNNIHVLGTTTGSNFLQTPDAYSNIPNSPQFLTALTPQLDNVVYSTTIGTGTYNGSSYNFVPIAFMVDKCNNIYFSGYYAVSGLPTTADAISTLGNSFYLGVLTPDAENLSFGTYYGKADHVDGGTSRFDKSGIVYQAVCSCTDANGNNVLNTLPNAWSQNQQQRCDIGVFKIDFEEETVTSAFTAAPSSSGCVPYTVNFNYTGQDGEAFTWLIDDVVIANSDNTTFTFTEPGSYNVMLVAEAGQTCNVRDTSFLLVDVLDGSSKSDTIAFCPGEDLLFLDVSTVNATYNWQDGSTGATYSVSLPGIYWVDINIPGCSERDSFLVEVATEINLELGPDLVICDVGSYTIDVTDPAAFTYEWNTGETTPVATLAETNDYAVTLTDIYGCAISDGINIIIEDTPVFSFQDELICEGDTVILSPGLDADYTWSNGSSDPSLIITEENEYWLTLDNGCIYSDTMYLEVSLNPVDISATGVSCFGSCNGSIEGVIIPGEDPNDLLIEWDSSLVGLNFTDLCPGIYSLTVTDENACVFTYPMDVFEPALLEYELEWDSVTCAGDDDGTIKISNISGGTLPYYFSLDEGIPSTDSIISGLGGGTYQLNISDENDCSFSEDIFIYEPFENMVDAGEDKWIELGDSIKIDGFVLRMVDQDIFWNDADGIWCNRCIKPMASPVNTTEYILTVINPETGCIIKDSMTVFVEKPRNIFIPNVFSPNEDGKNDQFTIFANQGIRNIKSMKIFDRWGELVFADQNFPPNSLDFGWNGKLNGEPMNMAVFVYIIEVEFLDNYTILYKGDVTLLR
ncbi:MAG: gliding motility-associated-like protein [Maribacter sp.]|jgi:gliding motility-associated-like protein